MSFLCGPTQNTSSATSGPPQQFVDAYTNLMNQAQGIASQPLQQYSGPMVAGLSPDQQAAVQTVQNTQGITDPYINSAQDFLGQATQPISSAAPGIAAGAGAAANGAAGAAGTGAVSSATGAAGAATGAANAGISLAQSGATGNAATANNAAATNVWGQLPTFSSGINQYMSPYTQDVVNSTQAEFNNQNAQTNQGIIGNAISQGAWGGDRAGVAQGIAAGQEALAQAPVIAGLENQGFQQGTQEFNTQQGLQASLGQNQAQLQANTALGAGNLLSSTGTATGQLGANTALQGGQLGVSANLGAGQLAANTALGAGNLGVSAAGQQLSADQANAWLNSQASAQEANLGAEAQSAALQGANAQLGTGALEQGITQEQLNVPYEQFQQQQAYPFQTTQFLSGIDTGLGGASGGTSTSTTPSPSLLQSILGPAATLGGAALLAGASGGAVTTKRATGGGITDVPDVSLSFIPQVGITAGAGAPKPPSGATPVGGSSNPLSGLNDMISLKGLMSKIGGKSKTPYYDANASQQAGLNDDPIYNGDFSGIDFGGAGANDDYASGGIVPPRRRAAGGGSGGTIDDGDDNPPVFSASSHTGTGIALPKLNTAPRPNLAAPALQGIDQMQGGLFSPSGRHSVHIPSSLVSNYGNAPSDANGKSTLPHTTYNPPVPAYVPPTATTPTYDPTQDPASPVYQGPLRSGFREGGIIHRDTGGGIGDDDGDAYSQDNDPEIAESEGIATHPIEDQPTQAALPPPSGGQGIAPPRATSSYQPRQAPTRDAAAERKQALGLALLSGGAGMMGSRSPHGLEALGQGLSQGVSTYLGVKGQQTAQAEKEAEQADTDAYRKATADEAAQKLSDEMDFHGKTLAQQGKHIENEDQLNTDKQAELERFHKQQLGMGEWEYLGPSGTDKTQGVYMNKKTQQTKTGPLVSAKPTAADNVDPDYVATRSNAIANYLEKPMSAFERRTATGRAIEEATRQTNPDYNETYFPASQAARTKFTSGPQGNTVRSFNVSLSHLATLDALRDATNNGNVQLANTLKNRLSNEFGGTAITDYNTAEKIVADEATKAVIGSAGTGEDRKAYQASLASKLSGKQGANATNVLRGLMVGQLHGLQKQYEFGTRSKDFEDMLDEDAKGLLHNDRFQPGKNPNAPARDASPAPAGVDPKLWAHATPEEKKLWNTP